MAPHLLVIEGRTSVFHLPGAFLLLYLLYRLYKALAIDRPHPGIPIVRLDNCGRRIKESNDEDDMEGHTSVIACPVQVISRSGPKIILPTTFADEIRNNESLSLSHAMAHDFFAAYRGFEAWKALTNGTEVVQHTVRVKLTQSLGLMIDDIVDETASATKDIFGKQELWHTINVKHDILELVARICTRVFLGPEYCQNQEWIHIAKTYTEDVFEASRILRSTPKALRPVAYWFVPACQRLRDVVLQTNRLLGPEIEMRRARIQHLYNRGEKPSKAEFKDTISWMEEVLHDKQVDFDFVAGQLSLTMAGMHTTVEAASHAILDLCRHPEIIEPLRAELKLVLDAEHWTWSKAALHKLELLDSFLKESQRMHPFSPYSMHRLVLQDVQLSDGTVLPNGGRVKVEGDYLNPATYLDPQNFNAYRFLELRSIPGQACRWQHCSTSSDFIAWGHGKHACPGRFFASNVLKVLIAHVLLEYDIRHVDGRSDDMTSTIEGKEVVKLDAEILVKRRSGKQA